jgi:hypothetical protein
MSSGDSSRSPPETRTARRREDPFSGGGDGRTPAPLLDPTHDALAEPLTRIFALRRDGEGEKRRSKQGGQELSQKPLEKTGLAS